jgi:hypothetical protein
MISVIPPQLDDVAGVVHFLHASVWYHPFLKLG